MTRMFGTREERRYRVFGEIVFEFTPAPGRTLSVEQAKTLQEAIINESGFDPWRDTHDFNESPANPTPGVGIPEYQYHNLARPELHVWLKIVPTIDRLRLTQLRSYEMYLEKLAKRLAQKTPGVTSVRSTFHMVTMSERFRCE